MADVTLADDVALSLIDDGLLGKCDDTLELRLPSEFKDALRRKSGAAGMSMANYVRLVLARNVYGEAHIASLLAKRIAVVTAPVGTSAREGADG